MKTPPVVITTPFILPVSYRLRAEHDGGATVRLFIGLHGAANILNYDSDQPGHDGWYVDRGRKSDKNGEHGTLEQMIEFFLREEGYFTN